MTQEVWIKVKEYRKLSERENARIRKQRSRDKLSAAAKGGNSEAVKKLKAHRESSRIRATKYANEVRQAKKRKKVLKKQNVQRENKKSARPDLLV